MRLVALTTVSRMRRWRTVTSRFGPGAHTAPLHSRSSSRAPPEVQPTRVSARAPLTSTRRAVLTTQPSVNSYAQDVPHHLASSHSRTCRGPRVWNEARVANTESVQPSATRTPPSPQIKSARGPSPHSRCSRDWVSHFSRR
ncbi:hypothetical protein B0H10DRAFT_773630 [Mycena sp. CBHHK59/15]|nr:hypothetical protein B0H10DRAFT_773630 [Mycena sp. CBHHK59/15]